MGCLGQIGVTEALRRTCAVLDVGVADVVDFGDSSNDASMLEATGDGVVIGNAAPEALASGGHVAPRPQGGRRGLLAASPSRHPTLGFDVREAARTSPGGR